MYLLSSLRSCPNWCISIRSKSTSWSQKWQMYRFFFLKKRISLTSDLAGPHGFEPGPKVPKTPVLPLHHGPIFNCYIQYIRYLLSCQVLIPACFSVVLVITLVTTWCPSFYHMDSSLSTSDCSSVFHFSSCVISWSTLHSIAHDDRVCKSIRRKSSIDHQCGRMYALIPVSTIIRAGQILVSLIPVVKIAVIVCVSLDG